MDILNLLSNRLRVVRIECAGEMSTVLIEQNVNSIDDRYWHVLRRHAFDPEVLLMLTGSHAVDHKVDGTRYTWFRECVLIITTHGWTRVTELTLLGGGDSGRNTNGGHLRCMQPRVTVSEYTVSTDTDATRTALLSHHGCRWRHLYRSWSYTFLLQHWLIVFGCHPIPIGCVNTKHGNKDRSRK